jgi:hypothetical protein
MADDLIALFEFKKSQDGMMISSEKHYRLVPGEDMTSEDLATYRDRPL